jgi:hypothetical protein
MIEIPLEYENDGQLVLPDGRISRNKQFLVSLFKRCSDDERKQIISEPDFAKVVANDNELCGANAPFEFLMGKISEILEKKFIIHFAIKKDGKLFIDPSAESKGSMIGQKPTNGEIQLYSVDYKALLFMPF